MKSLDGHHINYCMDNTIPGKLSCTEASGEGLHWSMGLRLNFRALRNYTERNRRNPSGLHRHHFPAYAKTWISIQSGPHCLFAWTVAWLPHCSQPLLWVFYIHSPYHCDWPPHSSTLCPLMLPIFPGNKPKALPVTHESLGSQAPAHVFSFPDTMLSLTLCSSHTGFLSEP